MPDLPFGILLVIFALFVGFLAYHCGNYYWWCYQSIVSDTRRERAFTLLSGIGCLALSTISLLMTCKGYLLVAKQLPTELAVGLVIGLISIPVLVLRYLRPSGERLGQVAKQLAEKARSEEEETDQLWSNIYDLRSKLRKKSGELKEALSEKNAELAKLEEALSEKNAELAKLEEALSEKNAELAGLREVLSKKESPAVSSPPQEKGKGGEPALPEELLGLKASGWKFSKFRAKGKEYVKVRRTTARGKREEKSLGRLDDRMKEALRAAGIQLG
jgi:flagellar motility protein MotE (MotC chaperone)